MQPTEQEIQLRIETLLILEEKFKKNGTYYKANLELAGLSKKIEKPYDVALVNITLTRIEKTMLSTFASTLERWHYEHRVMIQQLDTITLIANGKNTQLSQENYKQAQRLYEINHLLVNRLSSSYVNRSKALSRDDIHVFSRSLDMFIERQDQIIKLTNIEETLNTLVSVIDSLNVSSPQNLNVAIQQLRIHARSPSSRLVAWNYYAHLSVIHRFLDEHQVYQLPVSTFTSEPLDSLRPVITNDEPMEHSLASTQEQVLEETSVPLPSEEPQTSGLHPLPRGAIQSHDSPTTSKPYYLALLKNAFSLATGKMAASIVLLMATTVIAILIGMHILSLPIAAPALPATLAFTSVTLGFWGVASKDVRAETARQCQPATA